MRYKIEKILAFRERKTVHFSSLRFQLSYQDFLNQTFSLCTKVAEILQKLSAKM